MSIRPKWVHANYYWEYWDDSITQYDVVASATERVKWNEEDQGEIYVVVIDLSNCKQLPGLEALRLSANIHNKQKVKFILHNASPIFKLIGHSVSRFTGFTIVVSTSLDETINKALEFLKENVSESSSRFSG